MRTTDSHRRAVHRAAWFAVPAASIALALLIALDPWISAALPRTLWQALWLGESPIRLSLLLIPLAALLWLGVHAAGQASNYRRAFLVVLLVASQIGGFNFGPIDTLDLVTLIAALALLAEVALATSTPVQLPALILFGLLFLLLDVPYLVSMGVVPFFVGFIKLFKTVLLAFVLVNFLRDHDDLRFFVRVAIAVAVASAVIGIVQSAVFFLSGHAFTLIDDFEDAFKPTPLGYILRSSALCPSAQFFSSFLLLSIPLFLWRLLESAPGWPRVRLVAGFGIVLAGILSSWNYGAIMTAAGMLVLAPFLIWPHRSIHLAIGLAFVVVAFYYAGILEWMYDVSFGDSGVFKGVSARQSLLLAGMETVVRNPFIGTGLDGFSYFTQHLYGRPVHNAGAQAWVELGLFAMLAFIAMVLLLATQALILGFSPFSSAGYRFRLLLLGMIGVSVLMFSEPFMNSQTTWMYLAFVQAAIVVEVRCTVPGIPKAFDRTSSRG